MAESKAFIGLTEFEGRMLEASLCLGNVANINKIEDMSNALRNALAQGEDDSCVGINDECRSILIPVKHARAVRSLISSALKSEFLYVEGMCDAGMIDVALQRLDSEHGPHSLIGIFKKVALAEPNPGPLPLDISALNVASNWG